MKKQIIMFALAVGIALPAIAAPKKILVVSVTTGFRHSSIPTAEKVLGQLAQQSGAFQIDYVQQPDGKPNTRPPQAPKPEASPAAKEKYAKELTKFKADLPRLQEEEKQWNEKVRAVLTKLSPESLKNYDGVIFANTTGDLPLPDPQGFIDWIRAGHSFVGMHSASDTFHGFRPYIEMLGGEFQTHQAQVSVDAINEDQQCAACSHLGTTWKVFDEIYIIKNFDRTKVHGLLTLNAHPNDKTPGEFPIAWKKEFGKGRVFYTSLGHREDVWDPETPANMKRENPKEVAEAYQKHIMGGIKWTLGLENCDARTKAGAQ